MLEQLLTYVIDKKIKLLILLTIGILPLVFSFLLVYVAPAISPWLEVDKWVSIALTLLLTSLTLAYLLENKIKEANAKPTLKYGILWDNESNPICKFCDAPLSHADDDGVFHCYGCDSPNTTANKGKMIPLKDFAKFL